MKFMHRLFVFLMVTLLSVSLLSETAFAAFSVVSCDDSGGVESGQMFDAEKISSDACTAFDVKRVFTSVACSFVNILNQVFSKFYCSIQYGMTEILLAVLTLYVVIFGLKLLMGLERAEKKSFILVALKIGAVAAITSDGLIGIGLIYQFFLSLITSCINWVVTAVHFCTFKDFAGQEISCTVKTSVDVFKSFDDTITRLLMGADNGRGIITNGLFAENGKYIIFIVILFYIAPPLFYLVWSLLSTTFYIFARSVVSFLMSIVAIAFLISLSPIFLSFMLFNFSYSLFDNWLKFLISYSLQPMIVFAIFVLWLVVVTNFTSSIMQLSEVMRFTKDSKENSTVVTEGEILKFCVLEHTEKPAPNPFGINLSEFKVELPTSEPEIKCRDNFVQYIPDGDLVRPEVIMTDSEFIYFLAYHFVSLSVIGYTFLSMLKTAPQIAQSLSASKSIMPLGAGFKDDSVNTISSMVQKFSGAGRDATERVVRSVANRAGIKGAEKLADGGAAGIAYGVKTGFR